MTMTKEPCPIGIKDCIPKGRNRCPNITACYSWTRPWPLPLARIHTGNACLDPLTFDSPYWLVDFHSLYPPFSTAGTMQERNWRDYFADYGYAQAEPLRRKKQEE